MAKGQQAKMEDLQAALKAKAADCEGHHVTIEGLTRSVGYLEAEGQRLSKQEEHLRDSLQEKTGEIQRLEEQTRALQARTLQCETKRGDDAKRALQEVQELVRQLREAEGATEQERSRSAGLVQTLEARCARLEAELNALRLQQEQGLEGSTLRTQQEAQMLRGQLEDRERQMEMLAHSNAALERTVAEQQACIHLWAEKQVDALGQVGWLQQQLEGKDAMAEGLRQDLRASEEQCRQLLGEHRQLVAAKAHGEGQLEALLDEVQLLKGQLQAAEQQVLEGTALAEALEAKEREVHELQNQVNALSAKCKALETSAHEPKTNTQPQLDPISLQEALGLAEAELARQQTASVETQRVSTELEQKLRTQEVEVAALTGELKGRHEEQARLMELITQLQDRCQEVPRLEAALFAQKEQAQRETASLTAAMEDSKQAVAAHTLAYAQLDEAARGQAGRAEQAESALAQLQKEVAADRAQSAAALQGLEAQVQEQHTRHTEVEAMQQQRTAALEEQVAAHQAAIGQQSAEAATRDSASQAVDKLSRYEIEMDVLKAQADAYREALGEKEDAVVESVARLQQSEQAAQELECQVAAVWKALGYTADVAHVDLLQAVQEVSDRRSQEASTRLLELEVALQEKEAALGNQIACTKMLQVPPLSCLIPLPPHCYMPDTPANWQGRQMLLGGLVMRACPEGCWK